MAIPSALAAWRAAIGEKHAVDDASTLDARVGRDRADPEHPAQIELTAPKQPREIRAFRDTKTFSGTAGLHEALGRGRRM